MRMVGQAPAVYTAIIHNSWQDFAPVLFAGMVRIRSRRKFNYRVLRHIFFYEKRLSNGSNFISISKSDYAMSSADNLPRSITCVCFARLFCLGRY